METIEAEKQPHAESKCLATNSSTAATAQTARRISHSGTYKTISFEAVTPGLLVRTTDDGHLLALDFITSLTNGDRKKASQTLARVASRPDTSSLLTFRRVMCKPKPRKLLSFSNAVQLLLVLPKRTVCMDIRKAVAGVLTDYFEYRHQEKPLVACPPTQFRLNNAGEEGFRLWGQALPPTTTTEEERCILLRRSKVELIQHEMELDNQRMRLPLDRLNRCMELMERCGPMTDEEQKRFRCLITDQAVGVATSWV